MQELGVLQKLQIVAFPTILLSLVYASGVALMWKRLAGSPNSSARWGISGFAALLLAYLGLRLRRRGGASALEELAKFET